MNFNPAKLVAALELRGMNQADLARATGWSEAKVSRYVHGRVGDVTLASICELAKALGVSPASLVDLDDVADTPDERDLLRNYRAAAERDKRLAREQVEPLNPPSD
jgi:transcriptional regulator with XRE-family HTH domain